MAPQRHWAEAAILGSSKRHSLSRVSADPVSPRAVWTARSLAPILSRRCRH